MVIVLTGSHHTLSETLNYMKVTQSGFMFGCLFQMRYLNKNFKLFDFVGKVPHLENTPKHEPTMSYFHLVECLRKCMMISGENNHHVHNGYGKEMAPSLNVKDTDEDKDEDESNNSIALSFDKPSAENLESESECNIVSATTELNYDEHIKPSTNVKKAS